MFPLLFVTFSTRTTSAESIAYPLFTLTYSSEQIFLLSWLQAAHERAKLMHFLIKRSVSLIW